MNLPTQGEITSDALQDALSGDDTDTLRLLGIIMLQNGLPIRAAIILDVLCELFEHDQLLLLSRAYVLIRSGEPGAALASLEKVFPDPTDPALAWLLRGQALSQLGRPLEAARAMRMFIRHRQECANWS